jgi:putative hydrolase of the HAD superfamily
VTWSKLRYLVFDIDDTLYLERDYVRSGFQAVASLVQSRIGVTDFFDHAWRAFEAGIRQHVFDAALADCGIDAEPGLMGALVKRYRGHHPKIELLPDARDCLDRLHGKVKLAALTDGPLESQRAKAEALGLVRWLAPIVFTDELGPRSRKPALTGFELIQDQLGGAGDLYAYVADNPAKDFVGPASLGWKTVRVRRPASLHWSAESGAGVDAEIQDLSGLEPVLELSDASLAR